jgi:membrane protein DedA with SNARE-associated domain
MLDALLYHGSYFGIILFLILTGCGLPIPEEVAIIGAGIASSAGSLEPWRAFAACLVGALLGDCVMYGIGYHFGHSLAKRHPHFAHLLHAERQGTIEEMMRRHGFKVFLLARFMVGLRSPVYLTAGILRISFRRFLLVDAFCATAVVGTFFWLSHRYGDHIRRWIFRLDLLVTVVVVAVVATLLVLLWKRRRSEAAKQLAAERTTACATPPPEALNGTANDHVERTQIRSLV